MRWNAPKLVALRSVRSRRTSELQPTPHTSSPVNEFCHLQLVCCTGLCCESVMRERAGKDIKGIRVTDCKTSYKCLADIQVLSCDLKLVKLSAVCTNEGRLFQTAEAQHENRRAAMFVDEDRVDSRSDVDDLRTYGESRQANYEGCWPYNIGRQSYSQLYHAQVTNGDPLGSRYRVILMSRSIHTDTGSKTKIGID